MYRRIDVQNNALQALQELASEFQLHYVGRTSALEYFILIHRTLVQYLTMC